MLTMFWVAITGYSTYAATTQSRYFAHDTVEDQYGVIAPWYKGLNGQCDWRVRITAETLKRYPWTDPKTELVEVPAYIVSGRWKITPDGTITVIPSRTWGANWGDRDYGYRAYYVLSGLVDYYRYTSDPAAIAHITMQANHLLDYTLTGADHPWPDFPVSVPVKFIQLDLAAHEGLALLQAYQVVGEERWFEAAKHWGDLFAANIKKNREPGSAPWDRYATADSSRHENRLTGGVALILEFLDELIRLGHTGQDDSIVKARDAARAYLRDPLLPAWTVNETWGRFFWDWDAAVQTIGPSDAAVRCFMASPDYFPNWHTDVRNIISLYLNHTSVNPASRGDVYSGAWAYPESCGCCGLSLDYSPMEMAAVYAQYGVLADSEWAREMARRQIILTTYHAHETGVVEDNIDGGFIVAGTWFKIVHPMTLKYVLAAMGYLPEVLGANRENHIMRTSSVVNSVIYGKGRIEYSTFNAPANTVDVLRLAFCPESVTANGKRLKLRNGLMGNGYTIKKLSNGDCIVTIRHDGETSIVVDGNDPQKIAGDGDLKYKGKWSVSTDSKDFGGKIHIANSNEAMATYGFTGNQVRLVGQAGPSGGLADVYLDGVKQLVGIDYWNPSTKHQQVLYYKNGLSNGSHELKIVVRGEKNPHSSGNNIYIDAVQWSDAAGSAGFGSGGGPTGTQRMIFGYTRRKPYVDSSSNKWLPGTEFVARTGRNTDSVAKTWWTKPVKKSITNTSDPELYRYGVRAPEFWVNVTVGPGKYHVRLKFLERRRISENPMKRVTTIHINGKRMVADMDIAATAGGFNKPVDLVFNDIEPQNGVIEIRFSNQHGGEATVQAIEVGPGVLYIQGKLGMRIEDDILVTETGSKILTPPQFGAGLTRNCPHSPPLPN